MTPAHHRPSRREPPTPMRKRRLNSFCRIVFAIIGLRSIRLSDILALNPGGLSRVLSGIQSIDDERLAALSAMLHVNANDLLGPTARLDVLDHIRDWLASSASRTAITTFRHHGLLRSSRSLVNPPRKRGLSAMHQPRVSRRTLR